MDQIEIPQQPQEFKLPMSSQYPSLSFSLYANLIKSKQTFLLVYTTFFAYLISSWTIGFDPIKFIWVNLGVFLAVSGSTLLNMYIDKDIDSIMERTKDRPLPSGQIRPSTVLKHGILFTIAGILAIGVFVNLITMVVVFLGFFFDVVIYSLWLKRRTRLSIIFGGIAGGLPAVAGRTAVIASIDITAILIGLFVLCWIPLHILTLALIPKNLEGYKKAKVPMWPVVSSKIQTIRVITISALLSSFIIVLTGLVLNLHFICSLPLLVFSSYIIIKAVLNLRRPSNELTFRIFKLSSMYMAIAFLWLFIGGILSSFFI
ncbi:MAG: heme o synthase [Candidatus Hodarchaeales archaeon]